MKRYLVIIMLLIYGCSPAGNDSSTIPGTPDPKNTTSLDLGSFEYDDPINYVEDAYQKADEFIDNLCLFQIDYSHHEWGDSYDIAYKGLNGDKQNIINVHYLLSTMRGFIWRSGYLRRLGGGAPQCIDRTIVNVWPEDVIDTYNITGDSYTMSLMNLEGTNSDQPLWFVLTEVESFRVDSVTGAIIQKR